MRLRLLLAGALAAFGLVGAPAAAGAATCVPESGAGSVDTKIVGDTCWDCGWIQVRGEPYTLFYCD
jgi:hypothetical protein